jgi:ribosomal protein L10
MSTKAFKDDKIKLIKEKIDKAQVAIVTEYKGLSVEEITKLRRALQRWRRLHGYKKYSCKNRHKRDSI